MLGRPELEALARYAREAIGEVLDGRAPRRPMGGVFEERRATFVTLRLGSRLIGCIGGIDPIHPLADSVRRHAVAAAFEDPRNVALHPSDLERLIVEVSVLGDLERIPISSEAEAIAALRPGVDGVVFEWHGYRSTFLPDVWASLPDPADFLRRLKKKAGLAASFWAPDVRLSRYTSTALTDPATEERRSPC